MTYTAEVLADSPIGYWRLDETSGTNAADSSGNSHAGTYNGTPTLNQGSLLVTDSNASVNFDGSDDYVNLSNPSALRVTSAFTLEAWVRIPSGETSEAAVIAGSYDGARVNYTLAFFDGSASSLKPAVGFYNGSWHMCQSSVALSLDAVHHLVGTWDGTDLKIYVDNVLKNTVTPGSSPTTGTSDYYIGSRWDNAASPQKFKGRIDEVAIYGTNIGATRIGAHYTAATVDPNGTALPAVVAGVGSVPGPTASGTASAAPSQTVGTGTVPSPTVTGTAFATPSTVAGFGAVPVPSGLGAALASPSTTAGVGAVPVPAAFGAGSGVATPNAVAAVGAVPAATVLGIALASPATVAGIGSVPASTTTGLAIALPAQVAGTGVVPGPFVGGIENATSTPDNVIAIGRVPRAIAQGQGSGGGGGSINGVTDYWAIKALG